MVIPGSAFYSWGVEPNPTTSASQRAADEAPLRRLGPIPIPADLTLAGTWLRDRLDPPRFSYRRTSWLFLRALGAIYTIAFIGLVLQLQPLLGADGLLPVSLFLERVAAGADNPWWQVPSLLWFDHSDAFMMGLAWLGVAGSLLLLLGHANVVQLVTLWMLYSSFVNVGQLFYGYGWEILLLETGFLAAFLVPLWRGGWHERSHTPSRAVLWLLRWVLFRVMFGAGLIKLRGDACWWDLSCLLYHYETQPIPNPLSPYIHHLPVLFHQAGVLFNHLLEVAVPFLLIGPPRVRWLAGGLMLSFQALLILSGNLCWLNYLTVVLCITCFDDRVWDHLLRRFDSVQRWWSRPPAATPASHARRLTTGALGLLVAGLSLGPVSNLLSTQQAMNTSFDRLHLVNTYGAFGHIGKVRREIILLGTLDPVPGPDSEWVEYEFKCKPGDPDRRPCFLSPYHLRLDWQMWFATMADYRTQPWFVHFVYKLLHADAGALSLLDDDPFDGQRPTAIRADLFEYHFAAPGSAAYWERERVGTYLPILRAADPQLQRAIEGFGWDLLSRLSVVLPAPLPPTRTRTSPRRNSRPIPLQHRQRTTVETIIDSLAASTTSSQARRRRHCVAFQQQAGSVVVLTERIRDFFCRLQ